VKVRQIFFILFIFLSFTGITCIKKPQWQTDVTIPIIAKSYSIISQLDTNLFRINSDSSIEFNIAGQLDTFIFIDSIRILDHRDTLKTHFSDFVFNNLAKSSINITPDSIIGVALPESIIYITIPPFNININRDLKFNNIGMALIQSCNLRIQIINNSKLTFDSIIFYLPNLEMIYFENIDSLSVNEFNKSLYNVTVESIISCNIFLASSGTGSESIPISRDDSLNFIITLDSLRLDSCCFRSIPPQFISSVKKHSYSLSSNYRIQTRSLTFRDGQLSIDINNQFPIPTVLQCSIPELAYDTFLSLPAQYSVNFSIDLANRNYHNPSDSLSPITLRALTEFMLDTNYICLGQTNLVTISYFINNIQIDSIAGTIIDTIRQQFTADTISIHLPDMLRRIETINATATIAFTNALAFPIELTFTAWAVSSVGSTTIDTNFLLAPGTPNDPQISYLSLDFTRLFNLHPEDIIISGNIAIIGTSWMNRLSYNTASYALTTPLRIVLRADTITFNRSIVRINHSLNDIVREYADTSVFYAHLQNHFPSSLSGEIILQNPIFDSVHIGFIVSKGVVDNNGMVIVPIDTNIEFSLNNQQTKIFADSVISVTVHLFIPNTDTVTITGQDYFKIANSYAKVRTQPILKKSHSD
jgi:hypothetical protein